MDRPSFRELNAKLKEAREAATAGRFGLLEPNAILADLLDLGFLAEDLVNVLPRIIMEISPKDYGGQRPPVRSYEKAILNLELFSFRWKSKIFGCFMYFGFALIGGYLWIVSLHENRAESIRRNYGEPKEEDKQ